MGEEQQRGLLWKARDIGVIQLRSLRLRKTVLGGEPLVSSRSRRGYPSEVDR